MTIRRFLTLILFSLLPACAQAERRGQPVELGTVSWLRDYEQATAESKKTGKPILLLFQEVPG